jgi:hypothetical protein
MDLENPPHDGINIWILASAGRCKFYGLTEHEAESRIMAFQGQTRRPIKRTEVTRAISKAYNSHFEPDKQYNPPPKPKWEPSQTRPTRYRGKTNGATEYDVWESSPTIIDDGVNQKMILEWLFPDSNGLVCVGKSAFEFHTARLDQFKDLTKCQFIVPCYMTSKHGMTQDGKKSMHCLDNCGERRYCVCDFDEPASVDHPAIIMQLKRVFDLVMVLNSGGKSAHAWFNVPASEEDDFWEAAIAMGADPALMRNRSSFVRIPFGTRDNGKEQRVLYFDHTKVEEEISCNPIQTD